DACEAEFGDGCVNYPLGAKLVEHTLADFISAIILGDFLTHQKNLFVFTHFFAHGFAKRFSELYFSHQLYIVSKNFPARKPTKIIDILSALHVKILCEDG